MSSHLCPIRPAIGTFVGVRFRVLQVASCPLGKATPPHDDTEIHERRDEQYPGSTYDYSHGERTH